MFHAGDLRLPMPPAPVEQLRDQIDVMIAPAGGKLTIAIEELKVAVDAIRPRIVIPCHYQVRKFKPRGFCLYPVEAFLSLYPEETWNYTNTSVITLTPETLPKTFKIYVMEHAG
jgi:hypothetical protein